MKTNVRIYSFQYTVFTIFYHSFNTPDVLERRLGICVFMKLCLVYAISSLVKSVLQILIDGNKRNKCVKLEKKYILVL